MMIHKSHGKTAVMFGHDLIQIRCFKNQGTACLGLAYNGGEKSQLVEPEIVLSFATKKSIRIMRAQLDYIEDFLYEDPSEIELEYY